MIIQLSKERLVGSKKKVLALGLAAVIAYTSLLAGEVASAQAAFPGTNGKIAFTSNRDGNQEIYIMNPDGTDQKRLTNNAAFDFDTVLAPDGMKIAFTSDRD